MIRILGAAAIVFASAALGFVMASELGARVKLLNETRSAAVYIKSEMEYRSPLFEECFSGRGKIFSRAAELIKSGASPEDAVTESAKEESGLRESDREIIYSYARGLKSEHAGGQIANVSLLITRLNETIREAREENGVKCRIYRSGGVLAGIAAAVILI